MVLSARVGYDDYDGYDYKVEDAELGLSAKVFHRLRSITAAAYAIG